MTNTSALGSPIVVHHSIVICGQYSEHEFAVVTDGRYAYAVTTDNTMETEEFTRDGDTSAITASCPCWKEFGPSDERCTGQIKVDLSSPHWTADPAALGLFVYATTPIEH